jgi:hypothetical protein
MNRRTLMFIALAASLVAGAARAAAAIDVQKLAAGNANKLVALQFLEMSLDGSRRLEAVAKFCAPGYVNYRESKAERTGQAAAPAGAAPRAGGEARAGGPPGGGAMAAAAPAETRVLRVLAEGEYVSIHYLRTGGATAGKPITNFMGRQGGPQVANMAVDIYHLVKGKITEKWTLVEAIDTLDMVE